MQKISNTITYVGAVDWNRRIFDALMPIPDGTTYNAYLVQGSAKTALIDTVEHHFSDGLMRDLEEVKHLDYIIIQHSEQDHSGTLPRVLAKYPAAKIVATGKGQTLLQLWFDIPDDRFIVAKDNDTVDLGGLTLTFYTMPWVHWPDTMVTHLKEEGVLFTCDLFGAHLATADLFASDTPRAMTSAKQYYAVIMQPFRGLIGKYVEKIAGLGVKMIAPSHGPLYNAPATIIDHYREWATGAPKNLAVIPFISMHDTTKEMVEILARELTARGVGVQIFDLTSPDISRIAESLVDAATIVLGSPVLLGGAHPNVLYAAYLTNLLKPKARYATVIGSLGWGGKMVEQLTGIMPDLKVELLEPVLVKGVPHDNDRAALANLAQTIAEKHRE